ncbi:MAG TPA: hypothetical protein VLV83_19315 [Acidobacteriota bacterium]|nr:hypothetical protein [Acidobacteriota bacterium]
MQTVTEMALMGAERGVFTRGQAALWARSRGPRLDGLLKRAVGEGELLRLKKGLYCLSDRYLRHRIEPLAVAQQLHGPSYVSLETALSYHGWIPEGVRIIASVTSKRSCSFETPLGLFTFTRVPQRRFLAGVRRTSAGENGAFLLATALKALADLVYVQRRDWQSARPVIESLRVDEADLKTLTGDLFDEVQSAYKPGRVSRFLDGLRRDLNL